MRTLSPWFIFLMIKLGLYQHWQGDFHQVTAVLPHEETGEYHVVHRCMRQREPTLTSLEAFTRQEEGLAGEPVARYTFVGNNDEWDAALANVFEGILAQADARRATEQGYQDLFVTLRDGGIAATVKKAHDQMISVVLNTEAVLRKQTGASLPAQAHDLLLGLPLMQAIVRRDIEKKEGSGCCADKTRFLIRHHLYQLLGVTPTPVAEKP
jgi:hypothetical protein